MDFTTSGSYLPTKSSEVLLTTFAGKEDVWKNKAIVIAGATSVGKSAVAKKLCKFLDAEIVIADSVQIYKYMNIGSNKPSEEEMQEIPHHLVNAYLPSETLSTGEYCKIAADIIKDIISRDKVPIIVGGSTMWVQWLVHGIPDAPKATEEIAKMAEDLLKESESSNDWNLAMSVIRSYDPIRADKLARNDWYRMRRYLEVALSVREKQSTNESEESEEENDIPQSVEGIRQPLLEDIDVRTFFISEERENLYHTIDKRCVEMLTKGLLEEVFNLLNQGLLTRNLPVSKSIGYRQSIDYLLNQVIEPLDLLAFDQYLSDFASATRNYAKRQLNWYRKDKSFLFLRMHRPDPDEDLSTEKKKSQRKGRKGRDEEENELKPYYVLANEILHWCSISQDDFRSKVDEQVALDQLCSDLKQYKKLPKNFVIQSDMQRTVLARMISEGFFKLPDDVNIPWVQDILDSNRGITPLDVLNHRPEWSADELDVRMNEGIKSNSRMKFYRSRSSLASQNKSGKGSNDAFYNAFKSYIEDADRYRRILLSQL